MSTLAIEVSGLTKQYDNLIAVKRATFSVPRGAICGFVGPNGAGKTTTIRMLLGLIAPTSGSANVLGHSITHPEKYLSFVGALIEGPAFYPALTGAENLRVLATLGGFPIHRVEELIIQVGLEGRGNDKYKTYSLGMKQRLGIAAALLPNPALLILDEPTNGLDPEGIQEVRDLLKKLASEGTTVFVSSHLLSEIEIISETSASLEAPHHEESSVEDKAGVEAEAKAEVAPVEEKAVDTSPTHVEHVEPTNSKVEVTEPTKPKTSLWVIAGLFAAALAVAAYMQPKEDPVTEPAPPLQVIPSEADAAASAAEASASSASAAASAEPVAPVAQKAASVSVASASAPVASASVPRIASPVPSASAVKTVTVPPAATAASTASAAKAP